MIKLTNGEIDEIRPLRAAVKAAEARLAAVVDSLRELKAAGLLNAEERAKRARAVAAAGEAVRDLSDAMHAEDAHERVLANRRALE